MAFSVTFVLNEHGFGAVGSVTVNGVTQTTASRSLVFYETPGAYMSTAMLVRGWGSISPSSGTITRVNQNLEVRLHLLR